jgi:hypothetical protein
MPWSAGRVRGFELWIALWYNRDAEMFRSPKTLPDRLGGLAERASLR